MNKQEKKFEGLIISGFLAAFILIIMLIACLWTLTLDNITLSTIASIGFVLITFCIKGFMIIEPNLARVILLFGRYKGTVTSNGFFWVNPFNTKNSIALRARNFDIEPIKVNDKEGNPIMIGAVLVWRIKNTYKAMFDIDGGTANDAMQSAQNFVWIQSNAALRQVAGEYAYDNNIKDNEIITLRSNSEEVSQMLEKELNSRLEIAGIEVLEARINYLAYASEIASVMLRRQQADAIIAAREKIVEGAVGMVEMALNQLTEKNIVEFDTKSKAALVSNLLVVLCADEAAQPMLNTGVDNK